jgi:hypothetical protein
LETPRKETIASFGGAALAGGDTAAVGVWDVMSNVSSRARRVGAP